MTTQPLARTRRYDQYFHQYEAYLRESYSSQRSVTPTYHGWSKNNNNNYPGSHFSHPYAYSSAITPNTSFTPYHSTPYHSLPDASTQYDGYGYGWANWFRSSLQPSVPLKFVSSLPCLKFSGPGLTMIQIDSKVRYVSVGTTLHYNKLKNI